jgi:hypothetical protein
VFDVDDHSILNLVMEVIEEHKWLAISFTMSLTNSSGYFADEVNRKLTV